VFRRLGLAADVLEADLEFLQAMFGWLTESQAGWDQYFHDWFGGGASAERAAQSPQAARYAEPAFAAVRAGLEARTSEDARERLAHPYLQRATPHTMLIDEVEALWAAIAERDDWSLFEAKLGQLEEMRAALGLSCHGPVAHAD
jgi:uncharacterized protein YdiU (UPF0061 family)